MASSCVPSATQLLPPSALTISRVAASTPGGLLKPSLAKARKTLMELEEEYGLNVDPDALIEEIL